MPDSPRGLVDLIKEWGDWLMFLLPILVYGGYKGVEAVVVTYKLTHTSAYKIAAMEKLLRESIMTQESCIKLHKACQDTHELRFTFGTQELEELKGQGQKTEEHFVRLEDEIKKLMSDNQKVLIEVIQKRREVK